MCYRFRQKKNQLGAAITPQDISAFHLYQLSASFKLYCLKVSLHINIIILVCIYAHFVYRCTDLHTKLMCIRIMYSSVYTCVYIVSWCASMCTHISIHIWQICIHVHWQGLKPEVYTWTGTQRINFDIDFLKINTRAFIFKSGRCIHDWDSCIHMVYVYRYAQVYTHKGYMYTCVCQKSVQMYTPRVDTCV